MQRKNSILKMKRTHNRHGFAMIMAMAVIVIIATIMALSMSMTAQTAKRTVDIYLYEQAILYSKSASELALLSIAQNGCQNSYNTTLGSSTEVQYDVNITMQYIYTNNVAGCNMFTTLTTPEQNGSVIMNITTTLHDSNLTTEPIRYFRRTIQKL